MIIIYLYVHDHIFISHIMMTNGSRRIALMINRIHNALTYIYIYIFVNIKPDEDLLVSA